MELNQAILLTSRLYVQSLGLFFSSLAGSLLGIIGALGFLMHISERFYIKIEDNIYQSKLTFFKRVKERQVRNCFESKINSEKPLSKLVCTSRLTLANHENTAIVFHSPDLSIDTSRNVVLDHINQFRDSSSTSKRVLSIERKVDSPIEEKYYDEDDELFKLKYRCNKVVPIS